MNSDHSPILLTLSDTIIQLENNPSLVNKHTDWEGFKHEVSERIDLKGTIICIDQLEEEVEKFIVTIQQAAWNNTPVINTNKKGRRYPKEIIDLIVTKRKIRKKWQQTRFPDYKKKINNLTQRISRAIKKINNNSLNVFLEGLTNEKNSNYSLWKATKNFKRPTSQISPIRDNNGEWARTSEQKAILFAAHLENIFQPNNGEDIPPTETSQQEDGTIKLTSPSEVKNEITNKIETKKSPGYDLITGEILKKLPKKAIIKLTNLINAAFRLKYVPMSWKCAEVIMILKPGKPPQDRNSYRPISLLTVMSKLFEKLLLKRLKPIIDSKKIIPDHQFGFREKHSTIDQVHRITDIIEKSLEEKSICSTIFLDVAQAFDKVWHEELKFKLKALLPAQYFEILQSYISERYFRIKLENAYSELKEIKAGVPQGSVLGPLLYLIYTYDLPKLGINTIATFADDTAVMATGKSIEETSKKLQDSVSEIHKWTKKWRIKLNEAKSTHVDFTNKKIIHIPVFINNIEIPYSNKAKYLGMTLDAKLRWKAHVKIKRTELGIRYKKMYWLLGRNSSLTIYNKLLLYKQIIKPIWTYGIQLWGCTKPTNVRIIQTFQNKVLRNIINAPWYIKNINIHRDLKVDMVDTVIKKFAVSHENRLHHHVNTEAIQLLDTTDSIRRLKRTKPYELIWN